MVSLKVDSIGGERMRNMNNNAPVNVPRAWVCNGSTYTVAARDMFTLFHAVTVLMKY